MKRKAVRLMVMVALLLPLQGCAAVALTLLSAGASVGGSAGIDYTMNGAATRTFTAGHDQLRGAVLATLRRMAITVKADNSTDEGRKIVAEAIDRSVEIELERLTTKATRMRVVVKQGLFFRDRATAGEIIAKTGQIVENGTKVTRTAN
jgi:uncharacterized protein DUF3568